MTFKTVREFTAAALASILLLTGCIAGSEPEPEWSRYRISYMDTFDTIVQNVGFSIIISSLTATTAMKA